jgi:hypothetical protein
MSLIAFTKRTVCTGAGSRHQRRSCYDKPRYRKRFLLKWIPENDRTILISRKCERELWEFMGETFWREIWGNKNHPGSRQEKNICGIDFDSERTPWAGYVQSRLSHRLLGMPAELTKVYKTLQYSMICYTWFRNVNARNLEELRLLLYHFLSKACIHYHTCYSSSSLHIVITILFSVKSMSNPKIYSSVLRICLLST